MFTFNIDTFRTLPKRQTVSLSDARGMTFLELIFVLFIVSIISSVVLFNYGSFSSNITLQNLAQDVALTIKQAQTNALSGTYHVGFSGTTTDAPVYGVYFNIANPNQYYYFYDFNRNGIMDGTCPTTGPVPLPTTTNECSARTDISSTDQISSLGDQNGAAISTLYVTFMRPFPEPTIKKDIDTSLTQGRIELKSKESGYKQVLVWKTGQISVIDGALVATGGCGNFCL